MYSYSVYPYFKRPKTKQADKYGQTSTHKSATRQGMRAGPGTTQKSSNLQLCLLVIISRHWYCVFALKWN